MWEHDFEAARLTDQECDVCARLRLTERGENPNLVAELSTGYVVLGDDQYIRGYTVLICKHHAKELFDLEPDFRAKFLEEMVLTAQAVANVFQAEKMHYELLGIGRGVHMHWHLFPRHAGDTPQPGPVWLTPKSILHGPDAQVSDSQRQAWIQALREEINRLQAER